jgi:hypothetical protein
MATNFYFQSGVPGGRTSEQRLVDQLIQESIKIYGFDILYLPRSEVNYDDLYGEDPLNKYEAAIPLEAYLNNVDGFGGDGELMQKFGIEIRDSCTFLISRNRWHDAVAAGRDTQLALPNRPAEADIIYLPMTRSYLEIKKVDTHDPFYQLGKLYVYKVQCELIQYSGEKFDTGNAEVDSIEDNLSLDSEIYGLTLETGGALLLDSLLYDDLDAGRLLQEHTMNIEVQDNQANNLDIRRLAVDILDFSEVNPFGEVI